MRDKRRVPRLISTVHSSRAKKPLKRSIQAKAPRYGLDRNGQPYDNPKYKFYANGRTDGKFWMCVHKPSNMQFPVPFSVSKSNVSQLVYAAFTNAMSLKKRDEDKTCLASDAEEREGGANMLLNLQSSAVTASAQASSSFASSSVFEQLFQGLDATLASNARQRLHNHHIDPYAMFDAFASDSMHVRTCIAELVLHDVNPSTLAHKILSDRLRELCNV